MHWVTNLLSILNWIQLEAIELQMSEKEASWYPNDATWQHICRAWFSASQSRNTLFSIYAQYLKDGIILPTPTTWQQNKPFCEPRSPMYLFNDEVLDSSASTSYLGPTSRYRYPGGQSVMRWFLSEGGLKAKERNLEEDFILFVIFLNLVLSTTNPTEQNLLIYALSSYGLPVHS